MLLALCAAVVAVPLPAVAAPAVTVTCAAESVAPGMSTTCTVSAPDAAGATAAWSLVGDLGGLADDSCVLDAAGSCSVGVDTYPVPNADLPSSLTVTASVDGGTGDAQLGLRSVASTTTVSCDDAELAVGASTSCRLAITTETGITPSGERFAPGLRVTVPAGDAVVYDTPSLDDPAYCAPVPTADGLVCDFTYTPYGAGERLLFANYAGSSYDNVGPSSGSAAVTATSAYAATVRSLRVGPRALVLVSVTRDGAPLPTAEARTLSRECRVTVAGARRPVCLHYSGPLQAFTGLVAVRGGAPVVVTLHGADGAVVGTATGAPVRLLPFGR